MQANLRGLPAGGALLLGAWVAFRMRTFTRLVAAVMALGAGALISALSFELAV